MDSMSVASDHATASNSSVLSSFASVDEQTIIKHLEIWLKATLGASPEDLRQPGNLLHTTFLKDTSSRCRRFASDPQVSSLLVQQERVLAQDDVGDGEGQDDSDDEKSSPFRYTMVSELVSQASLVQTLFILKTRPLDPAIPLETQVQIINLPGPGASMNVDDQGSPLSHYEVVHSILHNALGPYFDANTRPQQEVNGAKGRIDMDAKTGIPVTKKRWTELELSLRHLQQNVDIPDVILTLHPVVQQALNRAEEKGIRPTIDLIDPKLLQESSFHNTLQSGVIVWTKAIQAVTKMTRDPAIGSASQEINFWLSMESALEGIVNKLKGDGVQLTLEILKQAKRFQATVGFTSDTNLKAAVEQVQKYNLLMRDFPLDDLLSASSLEKLPSIISQIFAHLNKKLRICPYPVSRALRLVEAISGNLDEVLHRILPGTELANKDFKEFRDLMNMTDEIFRTWDENNKDFTNVAREVTRRRNEKFIPIKIKAQHSELQSRLKYIGNFRDNHEQLQRTIVNVLGPKSNGVAVDGEVGNGIALVEEMGDMDAVHEVNQAWDALRNVDLLDVTPEGTARWIRAEEMYNVRTSRVETSIIVRLRDRLATSRNANEMFQVFSKFNALLVRPKIRGAIAEYQNNLLVHVKAAIEALKERFVKQYGHTEASLVASLHDLPSVSGAIIWARQIERQLDAYMKKVEDVLGEDWIAQAAGQELQVQSENFRKKLDTRPIFETWLKTTQKRDISISGPLFKITRVRAAGNVLELGVNFDQQVIVLFKETRNLVWLNFAVPHSLSNISKDAKRVYPYAVTLIETVRTYTLVERRISGMPDVAMLLHKYRNKVMDMVKQGIPLKWESFVNSYELHRRPIILPNGSTTDPGSLGRHNESRHAQFIHTFSTMVSFLQVRTESLDQINTNIQKILTELDTCPYEAGEFETRLSKIQEAVDELVLEEYSNLSHWVEGINARIKTILLSRLDAAIKAWVDAFESPKSNDVDTRHRISMVSKFADTSHPVRAGTPLIKGSVLEITMKNGVIHLDPPLESARASWILQFHEWLGITCGLRKISAARFKMTINARAFDEVRFDDLPAECTDALVRVHEAIEMKLREVGAYVSEWLNFQSLWDLQAERVYEELGEELPSWLQMLQDIRKARATFDTAAVCRTFGHITIDYENVQNRVNAKYDEWQRDILQKFGVRLEARMRDIADELEKARHELEGQTLEASSTAQAVQFITIVQRCKRQTKAWAPEVETFRQGETTLRRQRYIFPKDWPTVTNIENHWDALNDLLGRKSKVVQDQMDALRSKIMAEDKVVMGKIDNIAALWNEDKPVNGKIPPARAIESLQTFEDRVTRLQSESDMVAKAKEALDIPSSPDNSLGEILEEVRDFKAVWANLDTISKSLNDLRENLWTSVIPWKIRTNIDGLITMMREMSSRMRQYAAFEHMYNSLCQLLLANSLLSDLKSDAIRDRHWDKIFKDLGNGKRYSRSSMTLGDVWDLNLGASEAILRDIIVQARGEMVLEEFVKQVRETWSSYTLELVNYKTGWRLIRGWDDLFAKCSENLNSLQAMRHSPYYKQFEEEATSWEDKLNRVHVLFDIWIDVQRQWVYLEGVFNGNTDIKHLLPTESSRFQNINSEFSSVMKKVYKSPTVMEVLGIQGIQKSLERLADLLNKIQKALGEYLEKERVSFPRFYFVGDEDLLEMIGNSKDSHRIAKHFKKMFAGLNGLVLKDDSIIIGFSSTENEEIMLRKEISLETTPKINDWLTLLENGMRNTLAELLAEAYEEYMPLFMAPEIDRQALLRYIEAYPSQIGVLAGQAVWTTTVEQALAEGGQNLPYLFAREQTILKHLADTVLGDLSVIERKKSEQFITECVHQRDVIEKLINLGAQSPTHYMWLLQMRYVYTPKGDYLSRLSVKMADATLAYGFEYLGVPERLVRTPLTDRCFLTLTQGLCQRLGGSPYGPAGTGKTESVKALGLQLGRFTLVFCCDDTFDFQAMGRIFLGICQVGAWGCFDEFNRLEERILSAVSQQIQNIQVGLKQCAEDNAAQIELIGRQLRVNNNTGIFITMNPGYAGRSNLPDNLKKLFRSVAMSKPDKELIAEVMLYSQGFNKAKELSRQTVPFFDKCSSKLSKQDHYDFGLRALKSVLVSSGGMKRARLNEGTLHGQQVVEPEILVQSIRETIAPKLIKSDVEIMATIEAECFPGVNYVPANLKKLQDAIRKLADERQLIITDTWMTKVLQLYQIQNIHHGVMMVGSSGTGKSAAWRLLIDALQQVEGVEGISHVIDSKVMSKEALYGNLDSTTREWTDGLFTSILRKIVDNLRGEDTKRHWIVFDGDVDPEWVENLNSVLDDNKLLTLPNGERLSLPSNVRVMFEVETLKYATLATVSRCGMVWFSEDTVTPGMMVSHYLKTLRTVAFDDIDEDGSSLALNTAKALEVQDEVATLYDMYLNDANFILQCLTLAADINHIMEFTHARVLGALFSLLNKIVRDIIEYNAQHPDFVLESEKVEEYVAKKLLLALVWSMSGDCPLSDRKGFADKIIGIATFGSPPLDPSSSLIDFNVKLPQAQWTPWKHDVPSVEVNTHSIIQTDVVIPTVDTIRHEDVLYSWLADHKPLLLCGPPGSGKTMTLFSALRKLPNMEVVGLNFSSATTPDLLIKTFEQHCEYKKTLNGVILSPTQIGRWLVVFCDEINLPAPDKYGTQRAISFLRQMIEHNGFWRTSDKCWVTLDRIQFVGACNPPTDAGRTPLGARFLRHAPLIMVDYPGELSLNQIYGTFNNAVLKIIPSLRPHAEALTQAMVRFYLESQQRFTPKIQPHYIYSPRELTRWVRGVYEAIRPLETLSLEGLIRIWAHEALRLFQDRLVNDDERQWTDDAVRRIALDLFPMIDENKALGGPILFSNWLSKDYMPVDREQLREFVKARLKTFCEEEVDVPLILFNEVLEHVLRIDRVFRQPQGHLILIGVSGSGKTTLARFVAWMNGLKVFQIKVHGKYSGEDFDEDLREVLRRCGTKGEKICFIMDESNVLDSGFLERMNTLLANAEVPGLFEGDDLTSLMTQCKESAQKQGLLLDSQEELYKWFTQQIITNLHVVFTMNPPEGGLGGKAATSPALFNRCVLNWFGDWSDQALFQVGHELTTSIDLDRHNYQSPDTVQLAYHGLSMPLSHREAVVNAMVYIHHSLRQFNAKLLHQQGKVTFLTPRHYLDFVAHYVALYNEKREDVEEQQRHLNVGLAKLKDTVQKVDDLRASLSVKQLQLERKNEEASEKLSKMVDGQNEAEQQRQASLELKANLAKSEENISAKQALVKADLARAEPAVEEAKKSVNSIKKQQLTEMRSMTLPPGGVRLVLEAVCTLTGKQAPDWKTIQGIIRKDDFISSIVAFDSKRMDARMRQKMRQTYMANPEFTFEKISHASKACGPLVQWVIAQVEYSEILERVAPLKAQVEALENDAVEARALALANEKKLAQLDEDLKLYRNEYAVLISETGEISKEMEKVESKVKRSVDLLDSLSSERDRWQQGSVTFETQINTLVGDVLVAAAFLAYGGLYDQTFRKVMMEDWLHHLHLAGINHKQHNPVTEYLSTVDERLSWQTNNLPVDDLMTENAIILKRHNRYPLIIDPSGTATEFIQKESTERRLTVTSFLDDNFIKQLESSLRFGNAILIQDAEHLDPVLNHVLNKEYQKTGGRVLIQLGKQQIDFSSSFRLFLSTRDPSATFAPDICSRVTFANFTITQSSLRTQSLNEVLKSERPDVDERRSNLLKSQGEFKVRLRSLEKQLLQALNESRGNILDDDHIIETLETLKREAREISAKMKDTEGVMAEVDEVTRQYSDIARCCSSVFAVLEQLHYLNHFYQFSLSYFTDIFHSVLHNNAHLAQEKDHMRRRDIIIKDLFINTFKRTALGVLQHDRVTLALLLVQATPYHMDRHVLDDILDDKVQGHDISTHPDDRAEAFAAAGRLPVLKERLARVTEAEWDMFLNDEFAEKCIPTAFTEVGPDGNTINPPLLSLLLVKLFRLDRFVPTAERLATHVFGAALFDISDDLDATTRQVPPTRPIALVSSPGFDASYKVQSIVDRERRQCHNVAMGSNEGVTSADKAISHAAQTGHWVLIKNVHLAPMWLQSLEKRIDSLNPHADFRLFLSMESSPKIPVNLLRACRVLMYEQPAGIRANMRDTMDGMRDRSLKHPVERARLYLLLSFLHAVVQERLRYAPTLGWKGFWEFNDSDYECSAHVIDTWLEAVTHNRTNIAPAKIPWDLITYLVRETYGGKIDDESDYRVLDALVRKFLTPNAYDIGHKLVADDSTTVAGTTDLEVPSGTSYDDFMRWIRQTLPEREPPTYLGLPANAEKLLLMGQGRRVCADMRKLMDLLDEREALMTEEQSEGIVEPVQQ